MRTVTLSPHHGETPASLLRKSVTAHHPRLRERLSALALIADGLPAKAVAQCLGRHRSTVEAWVRCFNSKGLDGLQPTSRGHLGTILSAAQLTELRRTAAQSPRQARLLTDTWTGEVVVAFA